MTRKLGEQERHNRIRYTYGLLDIDGRERYVGQTFNLRRRAGEHWKYRYDIVDSPLKDWLLTLDEAPQVVQLEVVTDGRESANLSERCWIRNLTSLGYSLVNQQLNGYQPFKVPPCRPDCTCGKHQDNASRETRLKQWETRHKRYGSSGKKLAVKSCDPSCTCGRHSNPGPTAESVIKQWQTRRERYGPTGRKPG